MMKLRLTIFSRTFQLHIRYLDSMRFCTKTLIREEEQCGTKPEKLGPFQDYILCTRRGNRLRERHTSGGRPETEFSREMKMVDSNPRWRSEDIVDLDLVIPVRKSPAAKDDPNTVDAIGAILAMSMDDEIEQLPLNEIRKNRQKKYLTAGVSHVSFRCVYVEICNSDNICICLDLPTHRVPPSRNRSAEKTKPRTAQQQHHSKTQ